MSWHVILQDENQIWHKNALCFIVDGWHILFNRQQHDWRTVFHFRQILKSDFWVNFDFLLLMNAFWFIKNLELGTSCHLISRTVALNVNKCGYWPWKWQEPVLEIQCSVCGRHEMGPKLATCHMWSCLVDQLCEWTLFDGLQINPALGVFSQAQ